MKTPEEIQAKAQAIWDSMNDNERFGVKLALFPAAKMEGMKSEGFSNDDQHKVVVALMKMK